MAWKVSSTRWAHRSIGARAKNLGSFSRAKGFGRGPEQWVTVEVHDIILERAVMLAIEPLVPDSLAGQPRLQEGLQGCGNRALRILPVALFAGREIGRQPRRQLDDAQFILRLGPSRSGTTSPCHRLTSKPRSPPLRTEQPSTRHAESLSGLI